MAGKVDICNMALQSLSADFITSLDEDTPEAREVNFRFDFARLSLLQMHPWNFAMKRASLNAVTESPAFGYAYAYQLPVDFLYITLTEQQELRQSITPDIYNPSRVTQGDVVGGGKYRIEGDKLLSNENDVKIVYIADIQDTTLFSPTFVQILSYYIAAHIAFKLTGDRQSQNAAMQLFENKLREFKAIDSQQGITDVIRHSNWLSHRRSSL